MSALLDPINRRTKVVKWGLVLQTSVMFVLVASSSVVYSTRQRMAYIDHRDTPGVDGVSPPGPWGYFVLTFWDAPATIPSLLFFLSQSLADGFLVSSVPCLVVQVSNVGRSSALPLPHYLLQEPSGHRLPIYNVPRLYRYVFKLLQVYRGELY